jgi:1-deoxy-D-xylulose-5-phosphate reductoisomerase
MPNRVAILGSTGSIGTSALDVAARLPKRVEVVALSTHSRIDDLAAQAEQFRPRYAAITGPSPTAAQRLRIERAGVQLLVGEAALCEIVRAAEVDTVLLAVVGAAGVRAAIETVSSGKTLALANKEALVIAGSIVMPLAREHGAAVLPVDSEHSALAQCLRAGKMSEVARVILTASGGPFRDSPAAAMRNATVAEAMKHPTWSMGAKVTIDSATMFNKAMEIVEAAWLFDLPAEKIDVVIHPQSVVHSMVEFVDGSVIAQLSPPDMRTPIQHALTWPDRLSLAPSRQDFASRFSFDFAPPDLSRFPSLRMGYDVVRRGGTSGAALNAANEVAVQALQAGQVRLGQMFDVVERTIDAHQFEPRPSLDDLMETDRWARAHAEELIRAADR